MLQFFLFHLFYLICFFNLKYSNFFIQHILTQFFLYFLLQALVDFADPSD